MYFGASGASDYCGTLDFNTHISNIDASNPSKLEVFDGTIMLEPNEDRPKKYYRDRPCKKETKIV